jgi:hypothetical protein
VADYVLKVAYPLEREPSMADLQAQDEIISNISNWEPEPSLDDQLAYMGCLLEDIRNLLSSFAPVEQPGAADERPAPDSAIPPTAPGAGHPNLDPNK